MKHMSVGELEEAFNEAMRKGNEVLASIISEEIFLRLIASIDERSEEEGVYVSILSCKEKDTKRIEKTIVKITNDHVTGKATKGPCHRKEH